MNAHRLLLHVTLCISMLGAMAGHARLMPVMKFHLDFGAHADQVGTLWEGKTAAGRENPYSEGVAGMQVDAHGDVYLCDSVNGMIKHFSPKGQLLSTTEGAIANIQAFWVSPRGETYVRFEGRGSELAKYEATGHRAWVRTCRDLVPDDVAERLRKEYGLFSITDFSAEMTAAPGGDGVMVSAYPQLADGKGYRVLGFAISSDGALRDVVPYFRVASDGLWWARTATFNAEGNMTTCGMEAYSARGTLLKSITLDMAAGGGLLTADTVPGSGIVRLPDNCDGVYAVAMYTRKQPITVTETVEISADLVVNHYDPEGRFLAQVRFPRPPYDNARDYDLAVAPDGTLYHLAVSAKGVDVMAVTDR